MNLGGAEVMVMVMVLDCCDQILVSTTKNLPLGLRQCLEKKIHYVKPYTSCLTFLIPNSENLVQHLFVEMAQIYLESRVKWLLLSSINFQSLL